MFGSVVDEVFLETPMNWSGAENKNLLQDAYSREQIEQIGKKVVPKVCSYPFTNLAINSDGTVVCCCVDWSRGTLVGDVNESSLKEIWNGERLKEVRKLHLLGERARISSCKNCLQLPVHKEDCLDGVNADILDTK